MLYVMLLLLEQHCTIQRLYFVKVVRSAACISDDKRRVR
jgi:hypothetical protein